MKKFWRIYKLPTVTTLIREEIEDLQRLVYLEDKRADHHRAASEAHSARIIKLNAMLLGQEDMRN